MSATPQFPFADVEPTFLVHGPNCFCYPCREEAEALAFLEQFEAGATSFDDPFPWDPEWPTDADRSWFSEVSRGEPSADDLADYAAWCEVYNRLQWLAQFEAGYPADEPEHNEATEIRGHQADTPGDVWF